MPKPVKKEEIELLLDDKGLLNAFMKASFEEVDQDGSGFIDRGELATALNKAARDFGERPPMDEEVRARFAELDINDDERISFNEFVILMSDLLKHWANLLS